MRSILTLLALLTTSTVSADEKKLDLYLLIGQSNMAGRGKVTAKDRKAHPRVWMLNKQEKWVPAIDPLHFDKPIAGVGPGRGFAEAIASVDKNAHIGLIPCAAGGSPISVWKKGASWRQTRSKPYDDMLRRVAAARKRGTLKAILWHQGESDSKPKLASRYAERLADLIARIRKDLNAPKVPFLVGGMSDQALRNLSKRVAHTGYVSAEKLKLKSDNVHFTAEASCELGRRYAKVLMGMR